MPLKSALLNEEEKDVSAQPSVDFLNSAVIEPPKSSIGVRKIQPKRGGIGAKKGLGATKVKTNFADIEQRANMADQVKETTTVDKKMTEEEEVEAFTSVRLAYQDLSLMKQKEEEKMKAIDPNKAKQMERLGMGFNVRGAVSHSMMKDMQMLDQDAPPVTNNNSNNNSSSSSSNKFQSKFDRDNSNDFFDDYSTSMYSSNSGSSPTKTSANKDYRDAIMMGFETLEPIESNQSVHSMFSPAPQSKASSKYNEINDRQPTSSHSSSRRSSNNTNSKEFSKNTYVEYDSNSIQKKFGNAKGISSDQFFGNDQSSFERSANLTRFQGSNSISSADYFGEDTIPTSSRREFAFYFSFICIKLSIFNSTYFFRRTQFPIT